TSTGSSPTPGAAAARAPTPRRSTTASAATLTAWGTRQLTAGWGSVRIRGRLPTSGPGGHTMRILACSLTLGVLASLALTGCGGGGTPTGETPKATTATTAPAAAPATTAPPAAAPAPPAPPPPAPP